MKDRLDQLLQTSLQDLKEQGSSEGLYQQKVKYLGKTGAFSGLMKELASLAKEDRPAFGQLINQAKSEFERFYAERESELKSQEVQSRIKKEALDLSLPLGRSATGSTHPIYKVIDEIVEILERIGFVVRTGPWIETDFYNFEALNIPPDHSSRDMQDTFYFPDGRMLRTHTSPVQIRTMQLEKPPIRILSPGSVFRRDSDISHSPHFHQIEGFLVDKKVSLADLKGNLTYVVRNFFGQNLKTRFRPSYFPFTEPSAEVDCQCPICSGKGCRLCKNTGWVEIGGSGLVHPNVLSAGGIDPTLWQGFAWGLGVERMAIIKYGIPDIRMFVENDLRFLGQFP